ncbi:MAG: Gfo/Idh/MocA family oxidoreductase [Verrucomicrobiaceae bacterium]|nr:Gfo/Idh/MocA family oxidoreductase [Verrucomicrobiaceae bacterium]
MNTRRNFLKQSGIVAAGTFGFPAITRSQSPNSLLHVASVGVHRMGGNTMRSVAAHPKVKITAICDVDASHLAIAAELHPDASKHKDWRELLADHSSKFDAITVGTPDHSHAPVAVTAMRAKKHVYLQKPMAPTIHECRVIAAEAAKAGVVTQLGNQGRSSIESRMMVELLRSGAIGKIKEIIMWENKKLSWWPKNTTLRPKADPIPDGLDWDLWCGVRNPVPYLDETYHPQTWRAWFDFGVGELGDMGCHHFDATVDALKLTPPKRVKQTVGGSDGPLWSDKRVVEYHFGGTEMTASDTLKLTWMDGEALPDQSLIQMPKSQRKFPPSGGFWIGEKGVIFKQYAQRPFVLPEEDFPNSRYPTGFAKQDHYLDWVDAILEGRQSCDPFSHGSNLTQCVLVGTLADRFPGQTLEWDDANMKVTNLPAANAMLKRDYRDGWKIEGLG